MKILGIETSCDDTGISILEVKENKNGQNPEFLVLANEVASQIKVHQKYGGVFPTMAKREHQRNLLPTFTKALKSDKSQKHFDGPATISPKANLGGEAKLKILHKILEREPELAKKLIPFLKKYSKPDIDYIAITNGPGLEPCLWVGVNFARALSYFWDIPIISVNHIEGHILVSNFQFLISNFQSNPNYSISKTKFPAISLVVSGGHTQIVLVNKIGDYKILGETRDDAAGECFDKAAKILGLGYPGGPVISKLAEEFLKIQPSKIVGARDSYTFKLPRPMINTKNYDMSFSGLKTAILYSWKKLQQENSNFLATRQKSYKIAYAKEIQQAIIDVLLKKTFKAVNDFGAKNIILGGGVTANSELKKQFQETASSFCHSRLPAGKAGESGNPVNIIFPPANLSTDNGLMIAIAGYFNLKNNQGPIPTNWENLKADSNLRIGE